MKQVLQAVAVFLALGAAVQTVYAAVTRPIVAAKSTEPPSTQKDGEPGI